MHSRALSRITMLLMQGYEKNGGAVEIENLDRWPSDSLAVHFLSAIDGSEAARLLEVRE